MVKTAPLADKTNLLPEVAWPSQLQIVSCVIDRVQQAPIRPEKVMVWRGSLPRPVCARGLHPPRIRHIVSRGCRLGLEV